MDLLPLMTRITNGPEITVPLKSRFVNFPFIIIWSLFQTRPFLIKTRLKMAGESTYSSKTRIVGRQSYIYYCLFIMSLIVFRQVRDSDGWIHGQEGIQYAAYCMANGNQLRLKTGFCQRRLKWILESCFLWWIFKRYFLRGLDHIQFNCLNWDCIL